MPSERSRIDFATEHSVQSCTIGGDGLVRYRHIWLLGVAHTWPQRRITTLVRVEGHCLAEEHHGTIDNADCRRATAMAGDGERAGPASGHPHHCRGRATWPEAQELSAW